MTKEMLKELERLNEKITIAKEALQLMASSTQFKEGEYGYQFIITSKDALKRMAEL